MGPTDGHLSFVDVRANSRIGDFPHASGPVWRASERLAETIERELTPLTSDWEYRSPDERIPVLEKLRDQGANLVSAMSGHRDRQLLVDLLSRVAHLNCQTDEHLPWEFLYLGDPAGPVSIDRFFGANAVMGRGSEDTSVNRAKPDNLPAGKGPLGELPHGVEFRFGYAEDNRLASARDGSENEIFSILGIATDKLCELSMSDPRSVVHLNEFLENSEHLTHFNCHAVPDTVSDPGALFVSEKYEIDAVKLDAARICPSSIIVLNCCHGHTMRHGVETTIATRIMHSKPQAVVATTARIDDHYATRWAHCFYQALHGGLDVPGSIISARRELLSQPDPDPSALLYAYLGQPRAKLRSLQVPQ